MEWIKNNKKEVTEVQLSTVNERMAMGNKLYASAWIFEIAAAMVGLFVAFTTGNNIAALEGSVSPEQRAQIILGSLPFVMVALAEVLKIPLVYLVYINRNVITKVFFSVVLFGLTLITFETLASAFENQFTNIIQKVQGPQEEIGHKTGMILTLKGKIKETQAQTLESLNTEYDKNITSLNNTYDNKRGNLESQRITIEATLGRASTERMENISTQITGLENERDRKLESLEKDYKKDESIRNSKSKSTRDNRVAEIKIIDDEIEKLRNAINKHDEKKERATGLTSFSLDWCENDKNCKKNYVRIEQLNTDKQEILNTSIEKSNESRYFKNHKKKVLRVEGKYQTRIDDLRAEVKEIENIVLNQKSNSLQIKNITKDLERIRVNHAGNVEQAEDDHKAAIKLFNINTGKIGEWRDQIDSEDQLIEGLNDTMREHEAYTQIYRFTKYRMGVESVSEVTLDDVTTTAFWWYGSLAALVSIMGVVLAFGALILKHPKEKYKELEKEKRHRLKNTIRRTFISLRKRIREPKIVTKIRIKEVPKEVIKEVPVDKVVLTEVPVETIKKEIVYEPLYTNDPSLLKFGTTRVADIPKELLKDEDVEKDDKDS
jgi:hypothetical protein